MVHILDQVFSLLQRQSQIDVFLITGLGNFGREYHLNRHNIGFVVVEHLSREFNIKMNRIQSKAIIGKGFFDNRKVILAKPQTYMNLSGLAVSSLVRFYKIHPTQLLIIHDDIDLPMGTLRLRRSGGSAGHKGIISITKELGSNEFPRLRFGIGRPPGRMDAADYVLQNFSQTEEETLVHAIDRAVKAVQVFLLEGLEEAMSRYNGPLQ
jgi:PTH1 family peptidyl-tRNA hydrolase